MPLTTYCPNCCKSKDNLSDYYCTACLTVIKEVEQYAAEQGEDGASQIRTMRANALAARREGSMAGRSDPRLPFSPIDISAIDAIASNHLDPYERLFDPRKIGR